MITTIGHTYKINSIAELDDDDKQERNTYTMISDNDKTFPSNDDEPPDIVRIYIQLGEYQT